MNISMNKEDLLVVKIDDHRLEVIISKRHNDIRICDGRGVVKVMFDPNNEITGVLKDDIYVWRYGR